MMDPRRLLAGVLLVVCGSVGAVAPEDFAYGIGLVTDGADGLYRLSVPVDVYATVVSPGLADIRVFNAAGEPVPHLIRTPPAGQAEADRVVRVPFFPLHGEAGAETSRLTVTTNDDGSVVSIQRDGAPDAEPAITAYLLDLTALERPVDALRLAVSTAATGAEEGLNARLSVAASENLADWRSLRRDAPLVRLDYQGHRLEQTEVDLAQVSAQYLRISWPEATRGYRLTGVEAVARGEAETPVQNWLTPSARAGEEPGTWLYDTGGHFPIQRAEIRPGYDNAVLDVRLASRPDSERPWRSRFSGEVYRLRLAGTNLRSGTQRLSVTSDRYWRLQRVAPENGGPQPQLRLGWQPDELYFVAQGPAPYTLAFGSARHGGDAPETTLSRGLVNAANEDTIATARAGERNALGGPDRLQPGPEALPWTRILLWALLLAAVVVLAFMAWRLYRQLGGADAA